MRRPARFPACILLAALAAAVPTQAAYHYVHYLGNFTPVYEKFNLAALPNNTVTFFVDDQGPAVYAATDSFGSVLSQIREAAAAWSSVSASALRVAFGGLESYTANPTLSNTGSPLPGSATPGGDVIFIDTPGLLGMGAPTTSTSPSFSAAGPYFPILRGLVMLSRDTSDPTGAGPSYSEKYFTTAVHEIGHALGLQHTWTSSAMSQDIIRNTSRARPLDADDIASLAVLYGNSNWQAGYGSISGRVALSNGSGVALASVVAISPTGPAVSTLTSPDGSYRIEGLPPNLSYLVYAHPLPPDAVPSNNSGLRLPVDQNGRPLPPGGAFVTGFSQSGGMTFDPQSASSFSIVPGAAIANVNFSVTPRSGVPTYDVQTYSRINSAARTYTWPGDTTIQGYPAFIQSTAAAGLVIAEASAPAVLPAPQSVTMLGGFAPATLNPNCTSLPAVCPYLGQPVMAIYFTLPPNSGTGPRHLVFNFGNDIYVLPSSVDLVQKGPPVINSVTANGDGTVTIAGAGFGPDSRVFFDGLQAAQGVFSGADAQGIIVVTPPPAAAGQVSTVTVYNSDGQNSTILPPATPVQYTYPANAAPQIAAINPAVLPAGAAASIDITTSNTNFVNGQVFVGFGSGDVTVSRVWVLSPTHLIANVVVAPNAAVVASEVSLISGMQVIAQPGAFQVQAARPGLPLIGLPIANYLPMPGLYPATYATIYGQNLGASAAAVQITLNNQLVPVFFASPTQINFWVPPGFPAGPATLNLTVGGAGALPVMVQIDNQPPTIVSVNNLPSGTLATVGPGDTVTITAVGLDPALVNSFLGRLLVTVAGLPMAVQQVTQTAPGVFQVQAVITQSFGASQLPLALSLDGSVSVPVNIVVR